MVVVVEVLPDLMNKVFVDKTAERIRQFVMDIFFVLALFESHISLQVSVAQFQQLVVLLQLAFVFLEQLVVQVLVVDRGIVHRDVEAGRLLSIFVACCLAQLLQVFSY